MAHALNDRVQETTSTTGTGTVSLAGAVAGFQTFVAGIGSGNTTYYAITDGTDWETGLGTVTSGSPDTLSRTTVLQSSNSDSLVSFAAGAKNVFCVLPADKMVYRDDAGDISLGGSSVAESTGTVRAIRTSGSPLVTDRLTDDGVIISLNQDGTTEGSISVSGTTVSYNTFCGGHDAQLASGERDETIPRGTVMSTVDEPYERTLVKWTEVGRSEDGRPGVRRRVERSGHPDAPEGAEEFDAPKQQLVKVRVSGTAKDSRVYGVFAQIKEDGDLLIHALGATVVRVVGAASGGDLLESAGDGRARVQSDDVIRASTIGKVSAGDALLTERLLPCVLYCG